MHDRRGVLTSPEAGFRLERRSPAPDLAAVIDFHWHVAWDLAPGVEHVQGVLPFPCVNLGAGTDGLFVHGPVTRRDDRILKGRGHALGTRIAAGRFPTIAYNNLEAHRTTDRVLTFGEAFGPAGERVAERLPDVGTPDDHRALVEAFIRERAAAAAAPPDPQALLANRVVVAMLAEPATTRVADVAARHGLSPRALQRLFRRYVGMTPKQVLQRSRLHEAVERVTAGDHAGADLALDLGYTDQAHFANAFRAATGRSPGRYGRTAR